MHRMNRSRLPGCLALLAILPVWLLFNACQTHAQLLEAGPDRLAAVRDLREDSLNLTGAGPDTQRCFARAVAASKDQDWDTAVNVLAEGARLAPPETKGVFLTYLSRMLDQPFPVEKVCTLLLGLAKIDGMNVAALRDLVRDQPMELAWPDGPVVLDWQKPDARSVAEQAGFSLRNHPLVEVSVNGVKQRMILDTGAQTSFLFADAAGASGLKPLPDMDFNLTSSNDLKGVGGLALAGRVDLGGLRIARCRIGVMARPAGTDNFDGAIGWPVLSQLVMVMDRRQSRITLGPPGARSAAPCNFAWIGDPVIALQGGGSASLGYYKLDTGSSNCWFEPSGRARLQARTLPEKNFRSGGINGVQEVPAILVQEADAYLDGRQLRWRDYVSHRNNLDFIRFDGVIGSDIALAGVLRLDYPAGRLEFEPYPAAGAPVKD